MIAALLMTLTAFAGPVGEMEGKWAFAGGSAETAKVDAVVAEAAGRFNFVIRGIAKGKIATATAIDTAIVISGDDTTIKMDFEGPDKRSRTGPSDGSAVPIPGREGTLTHKLSGDTALLVIATTPDGKRTTNYKRDGGTMKVTHTLASDSLGDPALTWTLTYKKQ